MKEEKEVIYQEEHHVQFVVLLQLPLTHQGEMMQSRRTCAYSQMTHLFLNHHELCLIKFTIIGGNKKIKDFDRIQNQNHQKEE